MDKVAHQVPRTDQTAAPVQLSQATQHPVALAEEEEAPEMAEGTGEMATLELTAQMAPTAYLARQDPRAPSGEGLEDATAATGSMVLAVAVEAEAEATAASSAITAPQVAVLAAAVEVNVAPAGRAVATVALHSASIWSIRLASSSKTRIFLPEMGAEADVAELAVTAEAEAMAERDSMTAAREEAREEMAVLEATVETADMVVEAPGARLTVSIETTPP